MSEDDAGSGNLFTGQANVDVAAVEPPVFFWNAETHQPHVLEDLLEIPGELALFVNIRSPGATFSATILLIAPRTFSDLHPDCCKWTSLF